MWTANLLVPPPIDLGYHGDVVAFDLDDTLYPEHDYMMSGFRVAALCALTAAGGESAEASADEAVAAMADAWSRGCNAMDALAELLSLAPGEDREECIATWVEAYRCHTPSLSLPDDSRRVLEHLSSAGVALALITDGRSISQRAKIKALGIDRFFAPDNIYISGERGHGKDDMEPFAYMAHRYPEARRLWYVADNPAKDFLYPNLMGWVTVCLRDSGRNIHPQNVEAAGNEYRPQHIVERLTELIELIRRYE